MRDSLKQERDDTQEISRRWNAERLLELIEAAEFAVDTQGDPTALTQLADAVVVARECYDAKATLREINKELGKVNGRLTRRRCSIKEISTIARGFGLDVVHAEGDTWQDVANSIEAEQKKGRF